MTEPIVRAKTIHRWFASIVLFALLGTPVFAHAQQSESRPKAESSSRPSSALDSFFASRTLLPAVVDTAASRATSTCPMPVARPDTTRIERMPRVRLDSVRMAPMPVAHGCVAEAK